MKTIQERYEEIKNGDELKDGIDKLIADCYRYKIFRAVPSAKYKREFKEDFEFDYPEYVEDLTRRHASDLRMRVSGYKEREMYELKASEQRAKRGYADADVWDLDTWFVNTLSPMLKQFSKRHHGVPANLTDKDRDATPEELDAARAKWDEILERMAFLIDEMNEVKCSMKNPYEREYNRLQNKFHRELGYFGEKAKTPSELEKEKSEGASTILFPSDFPGLYPTASDVEKNYFDYENKIFEYRDKCKNEFFELFSKYFWELWD